MSDKAELKGCPFCGSEKIAYCGAFVTCEVCGCDGPISESNEMAIQMWNTRAEQEKV